MEQLRQETDDAGPQDELEYWKRRMAKFKFLAEQMDSSQVLSHSFQIGSGFSVQSDPSKYLE